MKKKYLFLLLITCLHFVCYGQTTLKHHTSNDIINLNTISCSFDVNTWYRSFHISEEFTVTQVSFAVQQDVIANQDFTIKIYGASSFPGTLTEKASTTRYITAADAGQIVTVPISAVVTENVLVFSITTFQNFSKVGSNTAAQTAPSYLSTSDCGGFNQADYTTVGPGFNVSLIMEVTGTLGDPPVITLQGANPQNIELGDGYTELGATTDDGSTVMIDASDFVDAVGTYTIRYNATDSAGNMATEVLRTVNVTSTLSTTDKELASLQVFPNPTSDNLLIKGASGQMSKIELFGIEGKLLQSKSKNLESLDMSNFPNGIYFVKLHVNSKVKTIKVVKV